jgi:hypothetical protein
MSLKKHKIKMLKKYKILALLITLLTGLTFSSSVLSSFLNLDHDYKCRVEYKQLSLINSEEKNVKVNSITLDVNKLNKACLKGGENIVENIVWWLDDKLTNVVVDVVSDVECKEREWFLIFPSWGSYKTCDSIVADMVVSAIVDIRPDQIGFKISYKNYMNPDLDADPEECNGTMEINGFGIEECVEEPEPEPETETEPEECNGTWVPNIIGVLECFEDPEPEPEIDAEDCKGIMVPNIIGVLECIEDPEPEPEIDAEDCKGTMVPNIIGVLECFED